MVAVEHDIPLKAEGVEMCSQCHGTGIIKRVSEFSFAEDRRSGTRCQVGRLMEARLDDIIARAEPKDRSFKK